jgi:hypothetical protein
MREVPLHHLAKLPRELDWNKPFFRANKRLTDHWKVTKYEPA